MMAHSGSQFITSHISHAIGKPWFSTASSQSPVIALSWSTTHVPNSKWAIVDREWTALINSLWVMSPTKTSWVENREKACACMLSRFSLVQLFAIPRTVAFQAPLSLEFSRQEYWFKMPFPSPGDLPDPEIEPRSPTLQADSLLSEPPGKPHWMNTYLRITLGISLG